ncbi:MAG: hypothetical protein AAF730_12840 [Bacteroidota bacterium]
MEIVPILSTIILIGTIITFVLAIFAYIIYKRRERSGAGGGGVAPQPQPHVLVTPQTQQLPQAQPAANYLPPAQGQTVTLQDSYSQQYGMPQYAQPSVSVNVEQGQQEPPVQVNVQGPPARALPPAQQQGQTFWQDQQPAYAPQPTYQDYQEQPFQRQPLPATSQPQGRTPQARANDEDEKNDAWL